MPSLQPGDLVEWVYADNWHERLAPDDYVWLPGRFNVFIPIDGQLLLLALVQCSKWNIPVWWLHPTKGIFTLNIGINVHNGRNDRRIKLHKWCQTIW